MYFRRRRRKAKLGSVGDYLELSHPGLPTGTPRAMAKRPRETYETTSKEAATWLHLVGETHDLWCPCGKPLPHLSALLNTVGAATTTSTCRTGGEDAAGGGRAAGAGPATEGGDGWDDINLDELLADVAAEDAER
ncbi:ORF2 [Simian torque teno virus 30]|uniref:ORF2 n=1 Tax=Simian torque teno virus 30 TaxID=1619218 RepID=A0A0C5IMW1_9VIRU|nr:ORF2 [Simian torque teno virus 30]AJP36582.1 ORF2 [Simian torque teno virus 30]